MANSSFKFPVSAGQAYPVYRAEGWVRAICALPSSAGGINRIGFEPGQIPTMEAGSPPLDLILQPGTVLYVETTDTSDVEWSFWFSELSVLDRIEAAIDALFPDPKACPR